MLGSSLHAVATVVAAFLGGLALGARFLGTPLARRGDGARVYALLELCVGLIGVISLPVLRSLDPIVGALYRGLGGEGLPFALARFAFLFVLLVPPAALMGATLPVLVAHFERGRIGPGLARLYALNTLGAVAGSIAGGFLLMPRLGLLATTWAAAAVNAAVAWIAWRSAGPRSVVAIVRDPGPEALLAGGVHGGVEGALTGSRRAVFAIGFALSGFAALAFQIAWVRLFGLVFGSSVYSFAAVLGVYLTGLALGSVAIGGLMRRGVTVVHFARLQLILAAVAALMLHAFQRLPQWMYDLVERSGSRWGTVFLG
jgi:spermidine synthase